VGKGDEDLEKEEEEEDIDVQDGELGKRVKV
jgi:hypothetical protein